MREALDLILTGQVPYPAIVVDRAWNVVAANSPVLALTEGVEVDAALVKPPVNEVRASLHPRGLAPLIVNLSAWRAYFRERLERQLAITGDDDLAALIEEVAGYRTRDRARAPGPGLGMFATFDTPFEVTTSELAIELLFPADRATADALKALAGDRRGP